ncbi:peptidase C15 [Sphaerospermopsis aphanizomenoides BCCUSP55]|uniref:pyroglutamyl-peptidase I family protein n=1 Tax=Sphaerospermopsis aphanizomenoides TaxID=459663 RepID=UPI000AF6F204|nr:peptidase C15 [Sphaerospermopsis aphanizomenoides]MBK1986836.1 peptidase C15 [Sphaerospermopsis aphanizomenoides BCCUSP55]
MHKKILLTSFDTWLSDQESNSSDDLLIELAKMADISDDLIFCRRLPVDVALASSRVIAKINEVKPDYVICCGMAASRTKLSVEVSASIMSVQATDIASQDHTENFLQTNVDVEQLVEGTAAVNISYDCGGFVCEGLYYSVLDYLRQAKPPIPCLFIHVPILNQENLIGIVADFVFMIKKLIIT